jgi:hypothetical protein
LVQALGRMSKMVLSIIMEKIINDS